ncbi:zinc finger protein ZFP2-like [Phlebotomus papatasi]|uniref:zinc finger protein ZFP2-like n=1 Tax=Phlebotomus papatasi TaxID=29031 RepID=UPI002483E392|nr:zinc finger protein ZFP2-like [Phlebotomus papatasi]
MDFVNNYNNFIRIVPNSSGIISKKASLIEEIDQQSVPIESNVIQSGQSVLKGNEGVVEIDSPNVPDLQDTEEIISKLHTICRCCLIEDDKLQDIFVVEENGENLVEMLMNFANIHIRIGDILPPLICLNCSMQIGRIFEFKNQIEMAEVTLRHFVSITSAEESVKISSIPTDKSNSNMNLSEQSELFPEVESQISEESNCSVDCKIDPENTVLRCPIDMPVCQEVEVIQISRKHQNEKDLSKKDENSEKEVTVTETVSKTQPKYKEHYTENKAEEIRVESKKSSRQCKIKLKDQIKKEDDCSNAKKVDEDVSEDLAFKCLECKESFRVESDLQIHYSLHAKNGKKECSACKKEVPTLAQLKRHIKTHFTDKPNKCKICNKGFPEMGSLTRHFRTHSGEQRVKKHLCTVCGKGYYDAHSLSVHMRKHTGERPCICNTCGKTFIDSRLLNSHMKTHSKVKPYKCGVCQRQFTHQSTLTSHRRIHTGEKPYVCRTCGKSFVQSSNLSLHMRTHSGVKPYKCETCGRAFASSSTLITHNRTHTGIKPYKCGMCGKAFARLDLTAHIRTHTGEKPFQCTHANCQKRFTTKGQLNQHMRVHREEKPLFCPICQKRCYSSGNLKTHLKIHENPQNSNQNIPENVVRQTKEEAVVYTKAELNPLVVHQIHIDREENSNNVQEVSIENFSIQDIVDEENQLSSEIGGGSNTAKYIVSNVIQVPIFITATECSSVKNINGII